MSLKGLPRTAKRALYGNRDFRQFLPVTSPHNLDNEGKISQPGDQCRDKETNVDLEIGTLCDPPVSVEPRNIRSVRIFLPKRFFHLETLGKEKETTYKPGRFCVGDELEMRNGMECYECNTFICSY